MIVWVEKRSRNHKQSEGGHVVFMMSRIKAYMEMNKACILSLGIRKAFKFVTTTEEEGCGSSQRLHRALYYYGNTR